MIRTTFTIIASTTGYTHCILLDGEHSMLVYDYYQTKKLVATMMDYYFREFTFVPLNK